jgi:hypothetical protein
MLLASVDEYRAVVLPYFTKEEKKMVVAEPMLNEGIKGFIMDFNAALTQAYLSSDAQSVVNIPGDERLKKSIADEIKFLVKNKKVMEFYVEDIELEKVEMVRPAIVRVRTRETVSIIYLNLSDGTVAVPRHVAEHSVLYNLGMKNGGWVVVSLETIGVKEKNGN